MKFTALFILLCIVMPLEAQQASIQEATASIRFVFEDKDVDGTLGDFQFTGTIDPNAITTASIAGSVATETLDTDNWLRNRHLRGKKYFNAGAYPRISFTSHSIEVTDSGFSVSGTLTLKGVTKNIVWEFTDSTTEFTGTTAINTQDYGISIYDERSRNIVSITIVMPYTGY